MHRVQKRIVLILVLGIALVASAGWIVHLSRQLGACRRQQNADRQTLHELREALQQHNLQQAPAAAEGQMQEADYRAALAKRDKTIEHLTLELGAARAGIAGLQEQLANSNAEYEKALASLNGRRQQEETGWQNQLDGLKQELANTQADLQTSRQRITALESNNAKLRGDLSSSATRASDFSRTMADLLVLDRRREACITSITRRYRDITGEFRAMSAMLDSSQSTNPSAVTGPTLTRIQNAVSLADDDLRQLNELNDQAHLLQKKLAKK